MKSYFKIQFAIIVVALAVFVNAAAASTAAKASLVKLPKNIYQAIRTNDKIGRVKWDKHSIYRVRTFEIANPSETNLELVLSEVMRKTRFDFESAFENFCQYEFETNSWDDCAKGFSVSHRVENELKMALDEWVKISTNPTSDEKLFNDAVVSITNYVETFLNSKDFYEFRAMTDYDSAATYTTILVSKDLLKAVVVARNETGIVQ